MTKSTASGGGKKSRRLVLSVPNTLYDALKRQAEADNQAMASIAHHALYAYLTGLASLAAPARKKSDR